MHRRNSSKALDRRKSTSSVQSKHDSIDPKLARQHAHTAATLAFARARERTSADMGHSGGGLSRSNTANARQPDRYISAPHSSTDENGDHPAIKRQHSVRFVGPTGIHRSQSLGTRATQNPLQHKLSNATLRPMAITTNAPVPAAYRPPSRSSSIGKASIRGGTVSQYVTEDAFDEYYTREDDIASTPSSYRRVRRSKSMFSPLKAPSVFYTNGTPDRPESSYMGGRTAASYSQTPSTQPKQSALRAPKSMSFLKGRRDHTQSDRNDNAVQLARDRFFRDAEQQRLREQPSFLFRAKAQKQQQDKSFRKSLRASSANSYGLPVGSSNQAIASKESGLKDVARKASKTIRNKLKRVFGRSSKDEDPVTIPNQQVDARETHVRQYNGDDKTADDTFANIPHPNEASLSRVTSRVPSLHAIASNQQLKSNAGSVRSLDSDDKSRVTSWTSAGANTVAAPLNQTQLQEQHQRLSIINEIGSHVPSSSFSRARLANQFSAYPVVHRQSKSTGHIPAPAVDSARVYSALMKRLDENSPNSKLEATHKSSVENFGISSQYINHSPATIRQVPPSSRNTSSSDSYDKFDQGGQPFHDGHRYVDPYTQQWVAADLNQEPRRHADDVFSPKSASNNKENIPMAQPGRNIKLPTPAALSRHGSSAASYRTVPEAPRITPQEAAKRNEPIIHHPKIIREARSTFFGGGSSHTISRTTSPFRRAMTESDYSPVILSSDIPLPSQAAPMRNPLYQASEPSVSTETVNNPQVPGKAYSESIYSRTTSGQTPFAAHSSVSLVLDRDVADMPFYNPAGPGDVVIIDRTTYRPTMPIGNGHRATSSASSVEWKKWMSSEVAKLERVKENSNTSYVNYAFPTMPKSFQKGHVREAAQINDDEAEVMPTQVEVMPTKLVAIKQPLGLVQQQNPNIQSVPTFNMQPIPILRPILKNRSNISLVEEPKSTNVRVPLIPIPPPLPPPPPPPIPQRSPLRQMHSKSSLRSVGTVNTIRTISAPNSAIKHSSMSGRNLLHKRNPSQTTLNSTKASIKSVETPAKLIKRHRRPSTGYSASPGSGLTGAVERQFGSTSTNSRYRTPTGPGTGGSERFRDAEEDVYGVEGAGLLGPNPRASVTEGEAQAMGSKKMVDLFLSSRRKRMVSQSEVGGSFI
ncbi:hypothetical protein WAI453_011846 [Rhynchosporium graminicola]|uniref:Uncharacterized protein n=1 Tax=Rhynchosporium graminicola TaxID=2792576 RepID=A0A1E1K0R5_9HELO|nr:uncharacterized protein RCO7_06963 [Rhynchosporium commune]